MYQGVAFKIDYNEFKVVDRFLQWLPMFMMMTDNTCDQCNICCLLPKYCTTSFTPTINFVRIS